MSLVTSILTGGSNSHQTTSEEANAHYTDFVSEGIVGTIANTSGVAPATGGFAVNATGTPDTNVQVSAGVAYVTGTPSSQNSQTFRVKNSATAAVAISANSSGSTKYDWIYIKLDATNLNTPNTAGDNVATLVASRSSSATADDGTPPTYGYPLAVVTVANGFSTITNGNISDIRVNATVTGNSNADNFAKAQFDFVESGCVWTADSAGVNRNASMTSGVVWIKGVRLTVSAVNARTFTASKDTYVDLTNNGDGTAAFTYPEVNNNIASPALTTNGIRIAIIVAGATTIATAASINQGQTGRILPIASSIAYEVTDSLGNLLCNRDPNMRTLGYRQIVANASSSGTSHTLITASGLTLSMPIIIPSNRKIKLTLHVSNLVSGSANQPNVSIWEGTVGSGTQLDSAAGIATNANGMAVTGNAVTTPSSSSKTYNAGVQQPTSGTATVGAASAGPTYIMAELV